ncbi:hypothetical protein C5S36_05890, partial [Candidatus Methanophagaceae archaeon]
MKVFGFTPTRAKIENSITPICGAMRLAIWDAFPIIA